MSITATPLLALAVGDRITPAAGPRAGTTYVVTKTPRNAREVNYTAHPMDADGNPDFAGQGIRGPIRAFRKLDGAATPDAAAAVVEMVPYLPPLMPGQIVTSARPLRGRGNVVPAGSPLVVLRSSGDTYSVAVPGDDSGEYWRGVARGGLTAIPTSRVTVTITPE